jgi:hypothetical protein
MPHPKDTIAAIIRPEGSWLENPYVFRGEGDSRNAQLDPAAIDDRCDRSTGAKVMRRRVLFVYEHLIVTLDGMTFPQIKRV